MMIFAIQMMNFVFQMMSFANLFSDAETKVLRLFKHFGSVVRVTVRKKSTMETCTNRAIDFRPGSRMLLFATFGSFGAVLGLIFWCLSGLQVGVCDVPGRAGGGGSNAGESTDRGFWVQPTG